MATVNPVVVNDVASDGGSVMSFTWNLTTANFDGAPADISAYPERAWQVTGTFGGTGVVLLQGSNDGTNWAGLTSSTSTALTAPNISETIERTRYVRPLINPVGVGAAVTVTMIARRPTPLRT